MRGEDSEEEDGDDEGEAAGEEEAGRWVLGRGLKRGS